jgi:hypothetical protein
MPATFPPSDGLLRLSILGLQRLQLVHLISGLHEEAAPDGWKACGHLTSVTGYTEWIDAKGSSATLGWDWEIRCTDGGIRWHRLGLPFTNLLLVGDDRHDLPWQRSLECLAARVDALAWAEPISTALRLRYTDLPRSS